VPTFARAAGREAVGRPTPPIIGKAVTAMSNKHDKSDPSIRNLKQSWDDKDATREKLEQREKQLFLEDQANQIFAPIEDYFTRLDKVLHRVRASAKIEAMWEHLVDQRLRRVATVTSTDPWQQLRLDFTIQGASIMYRDKPYRLSREIEALILVITGEVERFLEPRE